MTKEFSKFESLRDSGTGAAEACLAARADGMDEIALIRMLRTLYGLSLADAKRITGALAILDSRQEVVPGGKVYWEGWDTIDGFYLVEANVDRVEREVAHVSGQKRFRVTKDGIQESSPSCSAVDRVPLTYFQKSLVQRLSESMSCVANWTQALRRTA